jgi:hypothetical protein
MAPSVKREDLIVPFIHVPPPADTSANNFVSQSMPMAAMMMRNKLLSWFSIFNAVFSALGSSHGAVAVEGAMAPPLQLLMAVVGAAVCYVDLIFPTFGGAITPKGAQKAAEIVSDTVSAATATVTK